MPEHPGLFTTPRTVAKRQKDRVYFDYLQNGKSKTIAAPYVLRAYPGAPVATPLEWSEVRPGLDPAQFNIEQCARQVRRKGRFVRRRADETAAVGRRAGAAGANVAVKGGARRTEWSAGLERWREPGPDTLRPSASGAGGWFR